MTTDLYIIAAGKGSRLGGNIPKALVPITDKPCLTTTLQQIGHRFEHVFIVINKDVSSQWLKYADDLAQRYPELTKNVNYIPISSGLGDGHAVMHGFAEARSVSNYKVSKGLMRVGTSDDVVIMWGDVFIQYAEIVDELLAFDGSEHSGLIPAVRENNPYVSLLVNDHMRCVSADFSKYGENHPTGFHDQSIFRFKRETLWDALTSLHSAFWKGGRYITPGGELSMLYVFHYLYNNENPATVYETSYPTLSFNTLAEVATIQKEIDKSWKLRNPS